MHEDGSRHEHGIDQSKERRREQVEAHAYGGLRGSAGCRRNEAQDETRDAKGIDHGSSPRPFRKIVVPPEWQPQAPSVPGAP